MKTIEDIEKFMAGCMYQRVQLRVSEPAAREDARKALMKAYFELMPGSEIKFIPKDETDDTIVFLLPSEDSSKLDKDQFIKRIRELC